MKINQRNIAKAATAAMIFFSAAITPDWASAKQENDRFSMLVVVNGRVISSSDSGGASKGHGIFVVYRNTLYFCKLSFDPNSEAGKVIGATCFSND